MSRQGETEMKKTLLALGLAVASMPVMFAGQAGQSGSTSSSSTPSTTQKPKKAKKAKKAKTAPTDTAPSK
jgi:hypothetical protein